jgi:hypothetical protein
MSILNIFSTSSINIGTSSKNKIIIKFSFLFHWNSFLPLLNDTSIGNKLKIFHIDY